MKRRYAHKLAQKVFFSKHPNPPWTCFRCKGIIESLGRRSQQGIVHHLDHDYFNNSPDNLEILHASCHHRSHHLGKPKPPGFGDQVSKTLSAHKKTEAHKENLSKSVKAYFSNPENHAAWYSKRWGSK